MGPEIQRSASYPLSVEIKKYIKFPSTFLLGPQGVVLKLRDSFVHYGCTNREAGSDIFMCRFVCAVSREQTLVQTCLPNKTGDVRIS